jgi:hypothetical protein
MGLNIDGLILDQCVLLKRTSDTAPHLYLGAQMGRRAAEEGEAPRNYS